MRPIILLPLVRKLLARIVLERIRNDVERYLPPSQAAYRKGRSTTDVVWAQKIAIESRIERQQDFTVYGIDMSSAFDTISRKKTLEILKDVINQSEQRIIAFLLTQTSLVVQQRKECGDRFGTSIGVPQGDCLSPVLFTVYLESAMRNVRPLLPQGAYDCVYADDVDFVTNGQIVDMTAIETALAGYGLMVNQAKTEVHDRQTWKSAKKVGTLLGTNRDIGARRAMARQAMQKLHKIFNSQKISRAKKLRVFKCYVEPVMLYGCSTWGSGKTIAKSLDATQRQLVRGALGVRWPDVMRSDDVERLITEKWSKTARIRRRKMFGHVMRGDSLAKEVVETAWSIERGPGRPPATLLNAIRADAQAMNVELEEIGAMDKETWRAKVFSDPQ